jgi:hypothetical protein
MPPLRRTNDRDRDVRALEAASRTAGYDGDEPGDGFITRHGMVKTSVADVTPPATEPDSSVAIIAADRVAASLGRPPKIRAGAQRSDLPVTHHPTP